MVKALDEDLSGNGPGPVIIGAYGYIMKMQIRLPASIAGLYKSVGENEMSDDGKFMSTEYGYYEALLALQVG